jgi:hypothetical protein
MLRTALKRKTRDALHKCYASHRIKKRGKLATRHINAMLRTALKRRKRKKRGKLATRYINAMLRTALKRGKLATRYLNAMLRTALKISIA